MQIKTVKKLVKGGVLLACLGVALISFTLWYATYLFAINDVFFTTPLYGFALFYGYLFGALALMLWYIKNINSLAQRVIEHQLQKGSQHK